MTVYFLEPDWDEVTTDISPENCPWTKFRPDSPELLEYLRQRSIPEVLYDCRDHQR